jgi:hypothetical protein
MVWFLLILICAVVLGFLGVLLHGLIWLLYIGIAVFLLDLVLAGMLFGRRRARRPQR